MGVLLKRTTKPGKASCRGAAEEREIEVIIERDGATFLWNDPEIQEMAEELGEPHFKKPRPCG